MRKLVALFTIGFIITSATAFASPTTEFQKGAIGVEIGSTLNSRVSGKGQVAADVTGKTGFKVGITAGLNDRLALQYKQGMFKSEDSTISGMNTYAQSEPQDVNLLYKIDSNLTFIAGYEHTKISYGKYVADASRSALHFGVTGTHKLNDKTTLFATLLTGKDVSLKEIGVSYKLSKQTTFNVSYAERNVNNVDLQVPVNPLVRGKENYTMKGITCLAAFKL